jgi:hypothetical protein
MEHLSRVPGDGSRSATNKSCGVIADGDFNLPAVRIQISRYTSDANPGWVECRLVDAWGKEWLFEEKVPVVSLLDLDEQTSYPQPGIIACQIIKQWHDAQGRELASVDTSAPWGVESTGGNTKFDILTAQLTDY